jgi:hypothetical protein
MAPGSPFGASMSPAMHIRTSPSRQTRAIVYRLTRWAGNKPDVTPTPDLPAEVPLVPGVPAEKRSSEKSHPRLHPRPNSRRRAAEATDPSRRAAGSRDTARGSTPYQTVVPARERLMLGGVGSAEEGFGTPRRSSGELKAPRRVTTG